MKIGFFLAHYPHPGGTTKSVRGLAKSLGKLEEVHILCLGNSKSEWREDTFIVHRFNKSYIPRTLPLDLLKFLSNQKFDLVILNGMFTPEIAILSWWLSQKGVPYIAVPHGPYHPELLKKNWFIKGLYKPIEQYVLKKAKAVQVLSSSHISYLRSYGVDTPVIVVPNGFDPDEVKEAIYKVTSEAERKGTDHVSLVFLGRIDAYHKGLDLCIEALSILSKKYQDNIQLIIQGPDWGDKDKLEKLSKDLGVDHIVHFLPSNYNESPISLIARYDCLILPSRYDGFGFVVLEAMLAKKPIIVSNQAGSAEHVIRAECGITVEPNPQSIASGIEEMINRKSDWDKIGERGYYYAFQYLTWNKIASEALKNYKKLCGI